MPNTTELQNLRQDVAALTAHIAALGPRLDNAVTHREVQALSDIAAKQRKRTAWTVLIAVLVAMVGALFVNNAALEVCWLRSGGQALHHSSMCNVLFPGYNDIVDEQRKQIGQFNKLVKQIPANDRRIEKLERRVHQLGG